MTLLVAVVAAVMPASRADSREAAPAASQAEVAAQEGLVGEAEVVAAALVVVAAAAGADRPPS